MKRAFVSHKYGHHFRRSNALYTVHYTCVYKMSAPQKDHPIELSSPEIFWTKHQNKRNIEIKRHHEINDDHSCLQIET